MKSRLYLLLMVVLTIACFFLPGIPSWGAEIHEVDFQQCGKIAKAYHANPFALTMQQLDTLDGCIHWQIHQTAQEADQKVIDRAIERNFSRGGHDE